MNQPHPQADVSAAWHWPIDLEAYDRQPVLTASEEEAITRLETLVEQGNPHSQRQLRRRLDRLIRPIHDALSVTDIGVERWSSMVHALLRLTRMRHRSLWGWTPTEWHETLTQQLSEKQRYPASVVAYLLGGVRDLRVLALNLPTFAAKVFGVERVNIAVDHVAGILQQWGYRGRTKTLYGGVCRILLANGSPALEDLTPEALAHIRANDMEAHDRWVVGAISRALVGLGHFEQPLPSGSAEYGVSRRVVLEDDIPAEWMTTCRRWRDTSTFEPITRTGVFGKLLRIGRWLKETHPGITHPKDWTRELAAEFVAAVSRLNSGDWCDAKQKVTHRGQPMSAASKMSFLSSVRAFFRDCQEWSWIATHFNPQQCFRIPPAILSAIGPKPRVIADDRWAKLLNAGLNLTDEDIPRPFATGHSTRYPLEMVRAVAIVWLFAGLRSDEIYRLRVGCVRWLQDDTGLAEDKVSKNAVCMLDIPVNKTSPAFTKPVDYCVGEAIRAWEKVRPAQPTALDTKTGERVSFLFSYRGRRVGREYINHALIPILCRKAGIPEQDARGNITSHRARSTIATQLYNAKEPMTLAELQVWLGHKHPNSTQAYTQVSPLKLAKSYTDAGYFGRNVRTIEVLIDQEAVLNGEAAKGLPWKYYDLGHGYCTYDFFEQCEHRMACAQCAFYRPKDAYLKLLFEKKSHLLHMRQDIPLTELELAAVEGDLIATDKLIAQLVDVPTPAGPTPRQLSAAKTEEKKSETSKLAEIPTYQTQATG